MTALSSRLHEAVVTVAEGSHAAAEMLLERGTIQIFTYRAGMLARAGHDLRLSIRRFVVRIIGSELTTRLWPDSLQVDGAVHAGQLVTDALSAADIDEIVMRARQDVLQTERFSEIVYTARLGPDTQALLARLETASARATEICHLGGELRLCGACHHLDVAVRWHSEHFEGNVDLIPSRWGITPYRALLGALRLQDRVRIHFALQRSGRGTSSAPYAKA